MENYQILTLNSGQPLILYQESEKVYMYTIYSGRIQSHGTVFDDVSGKIMLISKDSHYVCYISTQGRLRLYMLKDMRFVELLSLQGGTSEHREFFKSVLYPFQNRILLFYMIHNLEDSSNSLFYIDLDSLQKSSLVYQGNYSFTDFEVSTLHNHLIININLKDNWDFLLLDANLELIPLEKTNYYMTHTSSKYEKQIISLEESLSDAQKKHSALEKELYAKNNEILSLKSTQKHIANQYNELAEFAGKLQEELRKVRYL